jgi:aminopeptidase
VAASTRTSPSPPVAPKLLDRYATLIVELGANVQSGQIVELRAELEKAALVRAIAAAAYRRGARFVDANYFDPHVRRERVARAAPDTMSFVPDWHGRRVLSLGEQRCARITLAGFPSPGLYDDLEPALVAREPFPQIPEYSTIIDDRTTNWTIAACPTAEWASVVHPHLPAEEALRRLWKQVLHMARADADDPRAAWQTRLDQIATAKQRLNERKFDALHFDGPGTDLTLGLLPSSTWAGGTETTIDGILHMPNLPTEEVFTTPDPRRADGEVRSTRPLQLRSGALVEGLRVRFEGGRAVEIDADRGAEALRGHVSSDEGASRLGEVALVDRESRVGSLNTVFYTTLLDENAASHVALVSAYLETVGEADRERANRSKQHIDFMLGGDDVAVTGITREGARVPVLRDGAWTL